MCNLAGPNADLMLARLAAKHRIPVGVSTVASTPLERMAEVSEGKPLPPRLEERSRMFHLLV